MFEIYCINLKERDDRMLKIQNIFSDENYFKIKRFNAIKKQNGALGCICSHLEIIKENINKPYVIVIEDDLILNDTIQNIYNIIKKLIENISQWEIFNGTPTFHNFKQTTNIVNSKIKNTPFVNINWGQSTSFIIYSKTSYNKLITVLEQGIKKKFTIPIDILISRNFIQTTYSVGNLFYQNEDWSDIQKRNNYDIKYLDYQKNQEVLIMNNMKECIINKTIDYKIGIYSIFIGEYTIFYKEFIKLINKHFFPDIKKKIFIITNKNLKPYKNTYILKISDKFIKFPFPTLFRFKYFKQIPSIELEEIDYMFFINSNASIVNNISLLDLPIYKKRFVFVSHNAFYNNTDYNLLPFDKNKVSSAYIPFVKEYNYKYIGGGFFGASLLHFIELCNILYNNILTDLQNNYIAIWHDESHLNHFFINKVDNYFLTGIEYHVPEEYKNCLIFKKHFLSEKKEYKIIYLDKRKKIETYPKKWFIKKIKYIYNAGNEISNELIQFYQHSDNYIDIKEPPQEKQKINSGGNNIKKQEEIEKKYKSLIVCFIVLLSLIIIINKNIIFNNKFRNPISVLNSFC